MLMEGALNIVLEELSGPFGALNRSPKLIHEKLSGEIPLNYSREVSFEHSKHWVCMNTVDINFRH